MATRALEKLELIVHPDRDIRRLANNGYDAYEDGMFQVAKSADGKGIATYWSFLDFDFRLQTFEVLPDGTIVHDRHRLGRCGLV